MPFYEKACSKGTWLVLLHARRVPPHLGLAIDGNYNSLAVKGHELNIPLEAVFKAVNQKKIEAVFVQVLSHPVFSVDYQLAVLQEMIRAFPAVKQHAATCLSPVREFFREFYGVQTPPGELLFQFMERLQQNQYLVTAMSCNFNIEPGTLEIPFYTNELLQEKIRQERQPFYND